MNIILDYFLFHFQFFRFGNQNVAVCWNQPMLQDFLETILPFMKQYCVMKTGFFRIEGKSSEKNNEQEAFDRGVFVFKESECVTVVGPVFKRFLKSFVEPIIPIDIVNVMRETPSKHI